MKPTHILVVALAIFEASAQSVGSDFTLDSLSGLIRGCESGLPATAIQAQILETPQIRLPKFVVPAIAQQTCDCVKALIRSQMGKEIVTVAPAQRFLRTPAPVLQSMTVANLRSMEIPAFQLSPLSSLGSRIVARIIPEPIFRSRGQQFSRKRMGPVGYCSVFARSAHDGYGGSFPAVSSQDLLENLAARAAAEILFNSAFSRNIAGGVLEDSALLLAGPSVVKRGIFKRDAFSSDASTWAFFKNDVGCRATK